jgi:uncharacterized damage-inducible protein DinB
MYSIQKHLKFNVWANTKTAEVLREVADEIYFRENQSSFSSIAKTVLHMWGAQFIWFTRMEGVSLGASPNIGVTDKVVALDGLVKSSEDIQKFIESKDEAFLSSTYAYKNLKGDLFEDSYEETLFHVVNHSTYHRGQIITMLRQAGIENVVSTDLIHYLKTLKK